MSTLIFLMWVRMVIVQHPCVVEVYPWRTTMECDYARITAIEDNGLSWYMPLDEHMRRQHGRTQRQGEDR